MICSKCKLDKETSEFYKDNKKSRGFSYYCKSCTAENKLGRIRARKIEVVKNKGGKCVKCGYNKSMRALHFHHLTEDKDPSFYNWRQWGLERIYKELEDCILLCSNCHAEAHDEDLAGLV